MAVFHAIGKMLHITHCQHCEWIRMHYLPPCTRISILTVRVFQTCLDKISPYQTFGRSTPSRLIQENFTYYLRSTSKVLEESERSGCMAEMLCKLMGSLSQNSGEIVKKSGRKDRHAARYCRYHLEASSEPSYQLSTILAESSCEPYKYRIQSWIIKKLRSNMWMIQFLWAFPKSASPFLFFSPFLPHPFRSPHKVCHQRVL